jgi:hypothetical protein
VPAQAGGHRQHGGDDRPGLAGCLRSAVVPRRADPQRLLEGGDATLGVAGGEPGAGVGGEPVDVGELQPSVGDGREARVHGERQGWPHQAAADLGHADPGDRHLVLELVGRGHRAHGHIRQRGCHRVVGRTVGSEERKPDVGMLLEHDTNRHPHVYRLRLTSDDVGREADARVLDHGDDGDHVGRWAPGQPCLMVDGVAEHGRPSRHLDVVEVGVVTARAHHQRRVQQATAVTAARQAQDTIGAGRPEGLVVRIEKGQRSFAGHDRLSRRARAGVETAPSLCSGLC